MEDIFPILLFIIFFLVPLLEGLKKKKQQPPPPPQQRRMPQPPVSSRTEEVSTRPREQESAATMVPDDLWEILTGQKRPPVLTTPQPEPVPAEKPRPAWDVVYDPELDGEEEEAEATAEPVPWEDVFVEARRKPRERISLETLEPEPEPVIISLEENVPTVAQRHAAFHEKVSAKPQPSEITRPRRRIEFRNRSELQRAVLMMEILGPPKGLE